MQPLHILAYSIFGLGVIALAIAEIRHRFKTIDNRPDDFAEGDWPAMPPFSGDISDFGAFGSGRTLGHPQRGNDD